MYKKPENVEELHKVIADLEWESICQKEDIEKSAALLVDNLKPINILKNALQPVSDSMIGKWAGKLLLGYKKLLHRSTEEKKPMLISKY
jgi:hemerythrin superfamily protein